MLNFILKLFRPTYYLELLKIQNDHEIEMSECKSCDILQRQLEIAQATIDRLISPKTEIIAPKEDDTELKPIPSGGKRFIPYAIRQQMADASDRKTLELMLAKRKEMADKPEDKVSEEKVNEDSEIEALERDVFDNVN